MFKRAANINDLWDGEMLGIQIEGKKILLIHYKNNIYAYEDRCLHQSIPLSKGKFEKGVLTCSAHLWEYDVAKGCGINPGNTQLKRYNIKIENDEIYVDIHNQYESIEA